MKRYRSRFGHVSRAERRAADLFFDALMGPPARPRPLEAVALPPPRPLALPPFAFQPDYAEQPTPTPACGVFGPPGRLTLAQVRTAVVNGARLERTAWHTGTGFPRVEDEVALFGRLVSYYLAAESSIRPDHLTALQTAARAFGTFGPLLVRGMAAAAITAQVTRIKPLLLAAVATPPSALDAQVETALRRARQAHADTGSFSAWSAVFVSSVVRGAAIGLGLEAAAPPAFTHVGIDQLLKVSTQHIVYVREAWRRRNLPLAGTYHAFEPGHHQPEAGDIIVLDRRPAIKIDEVTRVTALPTDLISHGDVVVDVLPTHVVTIGGNVCNSVRFRHYPRTAAGFLEVSRHRLFVQENARGELAPLPVESCRDVTDPLDPQSTARVFTLLKLVEECRTTAPPPPGN